MKAFDCIEMKRRLQREIHELTREQLIAFYREGAEEFERRIREAQEAQK